MKRWLTTLLSILTVLVLAVGCSNETPAPTEEETNETSDQQQDKRLL